MHYRLGWQEYCCGSCTEESGFVVHSVEGAAFRVRSMLNSPGMIGRMGGAAREHVRRNFLITRHLADYLTLLKSFTAN